MAHRVAMIGGVAIANGGMVHRVVLWHFAAELRGGALLIHHRSVRSAHGRHEGGHARGSAGQSHSSRRYTYRACRTPLSVLALLEAGAIHYEHSARNAILAKMPTGERAVEEVQIREEVKSVLYNPSLSAYTAATHLVANAFHIKDAATAFGFASQLAALSLNLPGTEISRMRIAKEYADLSNEMNHLRNSQDRAFAFLNLLIVLIRRSISSGMAKDTHTNNFWRRRCWYRVEVLKTRLSMQMSGGAKRDGTAQE